MEEKANKKPVGLIISIIFNVILIGVIVAGIICGQIFTKKTTNNNEPTTNKESSLVETEVVNKEEEQTVEEKADTKSIKIDDSKDWVYIIKTDTKVESEDEETYLEYPQINMNMDHIKSLNENIKKDIIESSFYTETKYYLNSKILSLVITKNTPGDNYYIYVYNIDTTDGNILSNEELLHKMGITENLNQKIENTVQKVVNSHFEGINENEGFSYAKETSLNMNYYYTAQIQMPLFINGNGKLCTIVQYTAPAGSGGPWGEIAEIN